LRPLTLFKRWEIFTWKISSSSSSSSSSCICHAVRPPVDPFRSHVSRSLFKIYHDSFCQSDSSVSLPWVIYFKTSYLHVVSSFSCIPLNFWRRNYFFFKS
jgi:hypothetical protein